MSSAIKPTLKQKFNAQKWIYLLRSGEIEREERNYLKFAVLILQGVLGYSVTEDLDFEEAT